MASSLIDNRATLSDVAYYKAFQEKLKEVVKSAGANGMALVRGISLDEEDEEDEAEFTRKENGLYNKDEVDSLRYVLMTKPRAAAYKKAMSMIMGGQDEEDFGMFGTQDGNNAIMGILEFTAAATKKKTPAEKFDALIALTLAANSQDMWMMDNELHGEKGGSLFFFDKPSSYGRLTARYCCVHCGYCMVGELQEAIRGVGKLWSIVLAHTDAELGTYAQCQSLSLSLSRAPWCAYIPGFDDSQCPWWGLRRSLL
jgi:hypothetical protein